tara:strand:- start:2672 stop:2860 length:189 start_codon:yes stop_codon:yes gene_type:complete
VLLLINASIFKANLDQPSLDEMNPVKTSPMTSVNFAVRGVFVIKSLFFFTLLNLSLMCFFTL